jgi:putative peptidoglycan lipid II flippase
MKDSSKTIFQSVKQFLTGTLISRASGLLRDVSMAFTFGTSGAIAALMVAFRFAHLFRRLLGEGALQSAFIPKFEEIRKEDEARAVKFFSDVTVMLSLALCGIVLLCMGGLGLCYRYTSSSDVREILFLTLILMPSLFFICLYGLNSALLQCEKIYFIPSVAPLAFNVIWITGTIFLLPFTPEKAVPWLAGFIVLACAGQWLMTVPMTWKILKKYRSFPSFSGVFSFDVKRLFTPLLLSIAGVAATQVNNALDPLFARYADAEGPAFLWYAIRLEQLPLSVFGIALSSALLPPLSRAAKRGDLRSYRSFLSLSVHRCILFVTPMVFAYWVAGDTCVNLIFGYGDFGGESVVYTTQSLWAYILGLVPTALILIIAPAFYALDDYRLPAVLTAIAVVLNIVLNSLFVLYLGMGAAAVAFATSVSSWVNLTMLGYALHRKVGFTLDHNISVMIPKMLVACFFGSFLVVAVDTWLFSGSGMLMILSGEPFEISLTFSKKMTRFLVEASAFSLPVVSYWMLELKSLREEIVS